MSSNIAKIAKVRIFMLTKNTHDKCRKNRKNNNCNKIADLEKGKAKKDPEMSANIAKIASNKELYLLKLPNRTSSPSSCISGTACLINCEISFFLRQKPGRHFARNLREFGVARSEELEVNQ